MVRPRIPETDQGIQGEFNVTTYDTMMRGMRDKKILATSSIIKIGIDSGQALEVGPGPGYLGLEWLKHTEGTSLIGVDISPDMIGLARRHAEEYGVEHRTKYVLSDSRTLPFDENVFDAVFTSNSFHEWAYPKESLNEIFRVLKPRGMCYIRDLRRDMNPLIKWLLTFMTRPKEIKPGLLTSIAAAYTRDELQEMLADTAFQHYRIMSNFIGLAIIGEKAV